MYNRALNIKYHIYDIHGVPTSQGRGLGVGELGVEQVLISHHTFHAPILGKQIGVLDWNEMIRRIGGWTRGRGGGFPWRFLPIVYSQIACDKLW